MLSALWLLVQPSFAQFNKIYVDPEAICNKMVIDDWNTLDVYFANTTKHQYMTIASDYANNTDFACGKNLCLYDITNPLGVIAINVTSAGQVVLQLT